MVLKVLRTPYAKKACMLSKELMMRVGLRNRFESCESTCWIGSWHFDGAPPYVRATVATEDIHYVLGQYVRRHAIEGPSVSEC